MFTSIDMVYYKEKDKIIQEENRLIKLNDFENQKFLEMSLGKKKHYIIKII